MRGVIRQTGKILIAKLFLAMTLLIVASPLPVLAELGAVGAGENPAANYAVHPFDLKNELTGESAAVAAKSFYSVLNQILIKRGWREEDLCDQKDAVVDRILREYGSIFVVSEKALPPPVCMFTTSEEVENFQKKIEVTSAEIGGTRVELQSAAMEALQKARAEARRDGFDITPRGGAEAGRRGYADTVRLWKSRFEPACEYWTKQGRLDAGQVQRLKSLPIKEQVREVLALEKQGIYFNKSFNNSILYSVAAPGTSQHLSMLALDVKEFDNAEVRRILAKHGWFQTVRNDLPHFTYLGRGREALEDLGLKEVAASGRRFWVPNV